MVSMSSHESRFYNYNDKFSIPAGLIVHPASRPYDASVINRGHDHFHSLGLFSIKCNLIFSTCALYIAGFFLYSTEEKKPQ